MSDYVANDDSIAWLINAYSFLFTRYKGIFNWKLIWGKMDLWYSLIRTSEEEKKKKVFLMSKRRKTRWSQKIKIFEKERKRNCSLSELHGDSLFRTLTSYSFNFNSELCTRCTGFFLQWSPSPGSEQFLWFKKTDFLRFHRIFPFLFK